MLQSVEECLTWAVSVCGGGPTLDPAGEVGGQVGEVGFGRGVVGLGLVPWRQQALLGGVGGHGVCADQRWGHPAGLL